MQEIPYKVCYFTIPLVLGILTICISFYAHFMFHIQFNTMAEINTGLYNVQIQEKYWYCIILVVWYPIDYVKMVQICVQKCHSQSKTLNNQYFLR